MDSKNDIAPLLPAVVFIDSPWAVCTVKRDLFEKFSAKIIIVLDQGQQCNPYFSSDDMIVNCPLTSSEKLNELSEYLASHYQVNTVIGFSEISVFACAFLAEAFNVRGIGSLAALACRNKFIMAQHLSRSDVTIPDYFVCDAADANSLSTLAERVAAIGGFPVVCKPLMGFASSGVTKVGNLGDLNKAIRKISRINHFVLAKYYDDKQSCKQILIQEFVCGDEVAVDGFVQNDQCHIVAIIDKPDVSHGPFFNDKTHILPSSLSTELQDELIKISQRAVASLGLNQTPFHLEARIVDGRVYILEVAARIGFMRSINDAFGIDMCQLSLALKTQQMVSTNGVKHSIDEPRFAGNYCITAKKIGVFIEISNLETILSHPDIVAIPLFINKGARVAPPPEGNAYIGFILACADSYQLVKEALAWAQREINVVVD